MLSLRSSFILLSLPLINLSDIVIILSIIVAFFLVLLILGVRKSYQLKKENDRLNDISNLPPEDEIEVYKDFTEGHIYENNYKE